ncbi:uncharacterized protein LOC128885335 [Hylaeus anthracinus]|uniref:uncharacterized protein LOC128885335 n=1 Tax=Hylaeus anthracinus TaxID=313031 RepID=UPI0023B9DA14|nr:uncharacterized protein LOC128885335 [Hylaeus anthracinus]
MQKPSASSELATRYVRSISRRAGKCSEPTYEMHDCTIANVSNDDVSISLTHSSPAPSRNACNEFECSTSRMRGDTDENNESIVLREDGNIDANRLRPEEISGRSIVDFGYIFAELQKLSNHNPNMCIFTNLVITKTIRYGLKTKYFVECQMCRFKDNFWSEPTDENILDISRGAVYGTLLTGTGHTQLEELLAAIDVPCMSNKAYLKYESEVCKAFADAAEEKMRFAGEAEKQLAIARGDLINGIPHIPAVTDGSWMKRSYRGGDYDFPSGSAFIVGYYTRKILFVGVRNKYCVVCGRAFNRNMTAKQHVCFENWGRHQSSTSMESDIYIRRLSQ